MKLIAKLLTTGALLACSAPLALATPIVASINSFGVDQFDTSTITFGASYVTVGTLNAATITPLTPITFISGPVTYTPGGTFSPGVFLASINTSQGLLSFFVTSETSDYEASNGAGFTTLELKGLGYFTLNGYDPTTVMYDLNTSKPIGSGPGTITSFQASTYTVAPGTTSNVTPEPSSLILLGTGILGAAGTAFRRRRSL